MKAERYYWAIVAHHPEEESHVFFPSKPCTQKQAEKHAILTAYNGSLQQLGYAYASGRRLKIDARIASRTPLALGDYAHRLP